MYRERERERERERGRETYKVPNNQTVDKLQHAHDDEKGHEAIQELDSLRRLLDVVAPYTLYDALRIQLA